MREYLFALATSLMLVSCAATQKEWYSPDAFFNQQLFDKARFICLKEANQAEARVHYTPYRPDSTTIGPNHRETDAVMTGFYNGWHNSEKRRVGDEVYTSCMNANGFYLRTIED